MSSSSSSSSSAQFNSTSVIVSVSVAVGVVAVTGAVMYLLSRKKKLVALVDPDKRYALPLIEREEISHDTRRFRFALPSEKHVLGLPVGNHVHLSALINDKLIIRPYTPVSSDDDHGYVDFVIKVYFKNVHPRFPDGGLLTQHLESLALGQTMNFRGPAGRLMYEGNGHFQIKPSKKDPPVPRFAKKVGMIAGGTGITPMYQLIKCVLNNPNDATELSLLFANQTEEDILLKTELDDLAKKFSDRFRLHYTVDRPGPDWKFSKGFVSSEMISQWMPPVDDENIVLMCGPPPMIEFACVPNLQKLGYVVDKHTFKY